MKFSKLKVGDKVWKFSSSEAPQEVVVDYVNDPLVITIFNDDKPDVSYSSEDIIGDLFTSKLAALKFKLKACKVNIKYCQDSAKEYEEDLEFYANELDMCEKELSKVEKEIAKESKNRKKS